MGRKSKKANIPPWSTAAVNNIFVNSRGKNQTETFARVPESLLQGKQFLKLTSRQKNLYIYCLAQHYGKHKPIQDNSQYTDDCFYMTWDTARRYGYKKEKYFYDDLKALIFAGFIEKLLPGKYIGKPNIYRFSEKWKYK